MPLTITEALRLAAASQLLLVVGILIRDHRRSRVTAASSLLAACVVCYLVLPVLMQPAAPELLRQLARTGALAVPFAFWLAARLFRAANDIGLFLLVGTISMMILRVEPDLVRAPAKRQLAVDPPTILDKRLERLIEEEHVYTTVGLTIGALAERLGEHEYKVRQLINSRLGFRNFGAFLNHYRVRDALKVLADPGQKQFGVAEVAYRFGYSSLGPFNRAFKEIVGHTPTEYRKAALEQVILADSGNGEASSKGS